MTCNNQLEAYLREQQAPYTVQHHRSTYTAHDTAVTEHIPDGNTAGQKYETIEELKGIVQLDKLNETHGVVLVQNESGTQDLRTIELP